MPYNDGVLVTAAPDILYLADTDGDRVADTKKVEWTGFGTGSQQLRANALHWGLDNWIYGANGRCGGSIRRPQAPLSDGLSIRGRDFRFDPRRGRFEAISGQSQFGQSHNDWGDRFLCWNTIPVRQAVVPDRYLDRRPELAGQTIIDTAPAALTPKVFPISPPPKQFNGERADYYNALCGLTIFRGDRLGHEYRSDAFVCESLTNLVLRRKLVRSGPIYENQRMETGRDFLASTDSWFHPVNLATGPDGALYIVDFYRKYVEHPIYVASEKARSGTDWRAGHELGRLWRVRQKDTATGAATAKPQLSNASTAQLVKTLDHQNGWWRDTAQRLLLERANGEAIPLLRNLAQNAETPLGQLHAVWTLAGLDALDAGTVIHLLSSDHPQLRRHAVRLTASVRGENPDLQQALLACGIDPDRAVRFELALAIAHDENPLIRNIRLEMATRDYSDPWISRALLSGNNTLQMLEQLTAAETGWQGRLTEPQLDFLHLAGERLAQRADPGDLAEVLTYLKRRENHPAGDQQLGITLFGGISRKLAERGIVLKDWIKDYPLPLRETFTALIEGAAQRIDQPAIPTQRHAAMIELLASGQKIVVAEPLEKLLRTAQQETIRQAAARALADLDDRALWEEIYRNWNLLPASSRRLILQASPRSDGSREALLEVLEQEIVLPIELPFGTEQALQERATAAEWQRFSEIFHKTEPRDRSSVVEEFADAISLRGDVERGAALFKQNCLNCHTLLTVGKAVGPDLSGSGRRTPGELLADILHPSLKIAPDYLAYTATTSGGKVLTGLIVNETSESITLQDVQGEQILLPRHEIETLRVSAASLMPSGIEEKIGRQGLADLIAFLRNPERQLLE
jgi:putative membrane-bound dehydrogenase-like protein